jgi:hypothetical protein
MDCNLLLYRQGFRTITRPASIAMHTRKLFLLITALFGLAVSAFAQTKTTDATAAKVVGAATVTMPDGSTQPLTVGMKVPQGATITTGADGEVVLQTHASTAATIKANSVLSVDELSVTASGGKVTQEVTTLNLKSGNVISALDAAKKSVNNYKVRTAKGVAAARGTTFSVTINGAVYSVTTTSGGVSFTNAAGATFTVGAGQTSGGEGAVSIASMPDGPAKAAAVAEMTNVIAAVAVAASVGIVPAAELQTAVKNAVEAAPAAANTITQTAATVAPTQAANIQAGVSSSNLSDAQKTSATQAVTTGVNNSTSTTTTTTTTTTGGQTQTTTQVQTTTTPAPIDVSVVSRSN